MDYSAQLDTLLELDAQQDDLLRRLEELDQHVREVLAEWTNGRPPAETPPAE